MDVGVVGAGFAGTAAAILLRRQGHDVTLYERVASPQAVGAGILLQPTGLAVLELLGLRESVCARGARIEALEVQTPKRQLLQLDYRDEHPDLFGLGVHRGVLFELQLEAAVRSDVQLRTGHSVESLGEYDGQTRALRGYRGDGTPFRAEHELVIIADGARSALRGQVSRPQRDAPYDWGALWFVAEDSQGLFQRELQQFVHGTRTMLGFLPTGSLAPGGSPLTSIFWSIRIRDLERWQNGSLARWKEQIASLAPQSASLLEQIESHSDVLCATYHDVVMPRWHREGVVVIGDAAHCTSPQLGQGANLGLLDAASLAHALRSYPTLAQALDAHSRSRRSTVYYYQRMSRWLTPWFQSESSVLNMLRDPVFSFVARVPPIYRQMLRTMAGLKQGFFRRSLSARRVLSLQSGPERKDGRSSPK